MASLSEKSAEGSAEWLIKPAFSHIDETNSATTFISTRHGGVSAGPFGSLNLGYGTGDDRSLVTKNRSRLAQALGILPSHLVSARQRHGVNVWEVAPDNLDPREADILVTRARGIALLSQTADCVPIVLLDPRNTIGATVHAGWRGTVAHAAREAVEYLKKRFKSNPAEILAGIGPHIMQQHYEVGPEVIEQFARAYPRSNRFVLPTMNGHGKIDLGQVNHFELIKTGLQERNIIASNTDTFSDPEHFYSARRQKPFGVFATGIILH